MNNTTNFINSIIENHTTSLKTQIEEQTIKLNEEIQTYEEKIKRLENVLNSYITKSEESYNKNFNIGNIKSLKVFKNIDDFLKWTKGLYNITKWRIYPETYEERAKVLEQYSYWHTLKELFESQNLLNRHIQKNQLVTFFDTMYLMYQILIDINDSKIQNEMKIIMEYQIPSVSLQRIDYLLIFRNKILILEFTKASNSSVLSKTKTEKDQQLTGYKNNLISLIAKPEIVISTGTCVYLDESSNNNIEHNQSSINEIRKLINRTFKDKNAFEILSEID